MHRVTTDDRGQHIHK